MDFIKDNLSTILVGGGLFLIVGAIVIRMWKDKKAGKSSCGCNCSGCAMSDSCHKK